MASLSDTSLMPVPQTGWSREIVTLKRAVVAPPVTSGTRHPCGVYSTDGEWCGHAATWRGAQPTTLPFEAPPSPVETLSGRHLWCGQIWTHFGHWMAESMSRFWALDHLGEPPDGLVFMVKRPKRRGAIQSYQRGFFGVLGIDLPVTIINQPTEVEELLVPGQGFGIGPIGHGTPEFQDFMHRHLISGPRPEGAEKLYISRSALGGAMGGILLEGALEENLKKDGYHIYHPQRHPLREQIAAYRAADTLLGPDGSAWHLFGFVGEPAQKTGMILRRNSRVVVGIVQQLEAFAKRPPQLFNALADDWLPEGVGRANRQSFGQLDFAKLRQMLGDAGFVSDSSVWDIPNYRSLKKAVERLAARRKLTLVPSRHLKRGRRLARLAANKAAADGTAT